jgi:hypothetical protein
MYPGAMVLVDQAIPCILHMENRCGEKFIRMVALEGLDAGNKSLKEENEFLVQFQELVNSQILGDAFKKTTWKVPVQKNASNQQIIAEMSMPNPHVRKFLAHFEKIADLCCGKGCDRAKAWTNCMKLWSELMVTARKKEDFSDEEINNFQDQCDDFVVAWLNLTQGNKGMTNYIHVVAAGHLSYYLRKWRNLYRYSQQGWEGLNSVIKNFMFKRTQRGGHGGKKGARNSKVKPVARWAQRRLLFLSGDYKTKVKYNNINSM